jgi:uncharacterized protein YdhG (YjbR/CyaY superfamily)
MKKTAAPKNIDEYLAGVPEPARSTLQKVRATIRSVVPAETTEAISYGMPAFKYKGSLVAFGAFSQHCSFFPMSLSVIADLKDDLKPYLASKGTIHFALDKPLSAALVKKIVRARLKQNEEKMKKKTH